MSAKTEVIQYIKSDTGLVMTNGRLGGWVQLKDGSFVSEDYVKSLNRRARRKLGL